MNSRKKQQKIKNIARLYLLSFSNTNSSLPLNNLSRFLSSVEIAYASLSAPLKEIINKDFFYQDYPGWWRLVYKKSSYRRMKSIAVNMFLETFYEI